MCFIIIIIITIISATITILVKQILQILKGSWERNRGSRIEPSYVLLFLSPLSAASS